MSHSQARRYSFRARGDGGRAETCEGSHGSVGAVAGGDGEHCSKLRSKTAAEPCSLTQRKQPQHPPDSLGEVRKDRSGRCGDG